MKQTTLTATLTALLICPSYSFVQSYNLFGQSVFGSSFTILDEDTPLPSGSLIELGIFTEDNNLPTGTWFPLATSMIGSGDEADGHFNDIISLDSEVAPNSSLVAGTNIGLRFYNSTDNSGDFNSVIAPGVWVWPSEPPFGNPLPVNIQLVDSASTPPNFTAEPALLWENGAASAFNVATIPEPSTSLSALLGLALLASSRRRK